MHIPPLCNLPLLSCLYSLLPLFSYLCSPLHALWSLLSHLCSPLSDSALISEYLSIGTHVLFTTPCPSLCIWSPVSAWLVLVTLSYSPVFTPLSLPQSLFTCLCYPKLINLNKCQNHCAINETQRHKLFLGGVRGRGLAGLAEVNQAY